MNTDTIIAEKKFEQDIQNTYFTAKRECGYNATRFWQLVCSKGAVAAARQLIGKPGGTEGFTTIWMHGRLDLSVEALVLKPEYEALFTPEERASCKDTLKQYGYFDK